jgi:hypothetical protein
VQLPAAGRRPVVLPFRTVSAGVYGVLPERSNAQPHCSCRRSVASIPLAGDPPEPRCEGVCQHRHDSKLLLDLADQQRDLGIERLIAAREIGAVVLKVLGSCLVPVRKASNSLYLAAQGPRGLRERVMKSFTAGSGAKAFATLPRSMFLMARPPQLKEKRSPDVPLTLKVFL